LKKLKNKELHRVLIVATGALLSPLSFQQGESIPCIAHGVVLESE
jgi:stage V sporulation protein AD